MRPLLANINIPSTGSHPNYANSENNFSPDILTLSLHNSIYRVLRGHLDLSKDSMGAFSVGVLMSFHLVLIISPQRKDLKLKSNIEKYFWDIGNIFQIRDTIKSCWSEAPTSGVFPLVISWLAWGSVVTLCGVYRCLGAGRHSLDSAAAQRAAAEKRSRL